jgi:hypothetical protein
VAGTVVVTSRVTVVAGTVVSYLTHPAKANGAAANRYKWIFIQYLRIKDSFATGQAAVVMAKNGF